MEEGELVCKHHSNRMVELSITQNSHESTMLPTAGVFLRQTYARSSHFLLLPQPYFLKSGVTGGDIASETSGRAEWNFCASAAIKYSSDLFCPSTMRSRFHIGPIRTSSQSSCSNLGISRSTSIQMGYPEASDNCCGMAMPLSEPTLSYSTANTFLRALVM